MYNFIQPFILKPGYTKNYHPNDNDPNAPLKYVNNKGGNEWI